MELENVTATFPAATEMMPMATPSSPVEARRDHELREYPGEAPRDDFLSQVERICRLREPEGTAFLLHELARRMGEGQGSLTPILIEMRALEKGRNLDQLVAQHLAGAGMDRIDLKAFRYMLENGAKEGLVESPLEWARGACRSRPGRRRAARGPLVRSHPGVDGQAPGRGFRDARLRHQVPGRSLALANLSGSCACWTCSASALLAGSPLDWPGVRQGRRATQERGAEGEP